MCRWAIALLSLALVVDAAHGAARKGIRFWNLTSSTVTRLELAPAGTEAFGPNQCQNDPDGVVDHDERLRLVGVAPGRYDVRVADKSGRVCVVRNVAIEDEKVFSINDADLTDCGH
ncbi:MAG TPA: hypothetical protein VEK55_08500 [Xanthobacteraceae bacterium]|nr:hypothetical protein [Xanthobacteraceae bacterium]